uniref:Uncharacterized protein n=1 Tax=Arundo donax TaxID=35708 RepID=A0A0A9G182_ARUDO
MFSLSLFSLYKCSRFLYVVHLLLIPKPSFCILPFIFHRSLLLPS